MRYGDEPLRSVDHSPLERVVCAGEVLNAPAWDWLQNRILQNRVPVIDHMWQTETGGPVFGNPYGIDAAADQAGLGDDPAAGHRRGRRDAGRRAVRAGEKGIMVIRRPFPGLTPALWGEPERYGRDYWEKIPGVYYTGDSAHVDEDGYVWFGGRADEIIKIAGPSHRHDRGRDARSSSTRPSPSAASSAGPTRCAARSSRRSWCSSRADAVGASCGRRSLDTVRRELGPVAVIGELNFVAMLPKTRSGKIMRRVLQGRHARPRSRRHHDDRGRGLGRGGPPGLAADEGGDRGDVRGGSAG